MTFLVSLLIVLFVLAAVFALLFYGARQLPAPFTPWAICALCLIAALVLLGFLTGQFPMPGPVVAPHR